MISYSEAFQLTMDHVKPLQVETVGLLEAVGMFTAEDLVSRVDSPSLNVSLKDGYAVHSNDIASASPDQPVRLQLIGSLTAGGQWSGIVKPGETVRILSGAPVPPGTDAVVSEEFTGIDGSFVMVFNHSHVGRNILSQGSDIAVGGLIAAAGRKLYPMTIGLLAAGGFSQIPVVRMPRISIIATGDEVIAPGRPLTDGKLFASNLVTLAGWCIRYGFEVDTVVIGDRTEVIREKLIKSLESYDVIITSGGAWTGERDLVVNVLDELGWSKIYHRVRIGPGKAIGFGIWEGKTVFCLPGGPPSNHMAFLQLALPALHRMAGFRQVGLPTLKAKISEKLVGQLGWTQFVHGRLGFVDGQTVFYPLQQASRLQMLAETEAIASIPEEIAEIEKDTFQQVQVLVD